MNALACPVGASSENWRHAVPKITAVLQATTPDGLRHYSCRVCGTLWGSDLPENRTQCPEIRRHQALLQAKARRRQARGGEPLTAGQILEETERIWGRE